MAVAALFDIDGTLLARNTAPLYMSHLRRTGQARRRDVARTLYYLLRYKLGLLDIDRALEVSMAFVRGRDEAALAADCVDWYREAVRPYVFPRWRPWSRRIGAAGHVTVDPDERDALPGRAAGAPISGSSTSWSPSWWCATGASPARSIEPVCYGRGKVVLGGALRGASTTSISPAATSTPTPSRTCRCWIASGTRVW